MSDSKKSGHTEPLITDTIKERRPSKTERLIGNLSEPVIGGKTEPLTMLDDESAQTKATRTEKIAGDALRETIRSGTAPIAALQDIDELDVSLPPIETEKLASPVIKSGTIPLGNTVQESIRQSQATPQMQAAVNTKSAPPSSGRVVIEFRNVTKYYGRERVLDNISFEVRESTQLGLIGPGGCGKSLILKILCGLVKPDKGEVFVDGYNVNRLTEIELGEYRKKVGMLFQNYALFDFMTVEENIAFPMENSGKFRKEEISARVDDILAKIALPHVHKNFPRELSGGMKKRVTFARAVINDPPIIFYDDPTMGLDPVTSSKIFRMLNDFKVSKNTTSICITHDLEGARDTCDRWLLMDKGRAIFNGTTSEIEACNIRFVRQFWQGTLDI